MTIRVTRQSVRFKQPFLIGGSNRVQPPGIYQVETEEERLSGLSFPAFRRIGTVMELPLGPGLEGSYERIAVDPIELKEALGRDERTD